MTDEGLTALAFDQLRTWALSDEELGGEMWVTYCQIYGVDPETFAEMVTHMRERLKRLANGR